MLIYNLMFSTGAALSVLLLGTPLDVAVSSALCFALGMRLRPV